MNPNLMIWPVVVHALITLYLYIPMSRTRIRLVKSGKVKGGVYKLNVDEPEESRLFSNAIRNQNETGVLFYAGVLGALATANASFILLALAWAFVIAKTVHVFVHVSSNDLRLRRPIFTVAFLILVVYWVVFALQLTGLL